MNIAIDLSGLFKNVLGLMNYSFQAFSVARETYHRSEMRFNPGINNQALELAANLIKKSPGNKGDGA